MIFRNSLSYLLSALCAFGLLTACSDGGEGNSDEPAIPGGSGTVTPVPDFNSAIEPFNPDTRATDSYTPGDNNDIYWQANKYRATVDIVYDGATATVTSSNPDAAVYVSGAHVTVVMDYDIKTQINLSGKSDAGSLKIYSQAKVLLTLNNVDLKSDIGPAINSQSKKRLFVYAPDGTVNTLADAEAYSADKYYKAGSSVDLEDRKGAFFSEDNTIFSGGGLITIKGNNRHALATDGSLRILPGTTLCVEAAKKNAIHAKGSAKEFGVSIEGGYIYALCTGEAGRCIKSDLDVRVSGATLSLNNSSSAAFDSEENATSSPAAIKTDTNVDIENSNLYIKMTGEGAKGINADGSVRLASSEITVTSTGKRYAHDVDAASPAGIKADGNISIESGSVNVAMYADDSKSDAVLSGTSIEVTGGSVYTYAYGNCLSASTNVSISGGQVYAFSQMKEAVEAGNINISGGLTLAHSPVALVSASPVLTVGSEATIIAAGGNAMTNATAESSTAVRFASINPAAGSPLSVLSNTQDALFSMTYLAECKGSPLLIASPKFKSGTSWTLTIGGTLPSAAMWNGYLPGVVATSPTQSTPFSI